MPLYRLLAICNDSPNPSPVPDDVRVPDAEQMKLTQPLKSKQPLVLAIVGHSGAGKTTLIETLMPILNKHQLRVATIKHSHHQLALDTQGKDSWRHKQAGAAASMLLTPDRMQLVSDAPEPHDPTRWAQRYFSEMDIVLAEGFSTASCSKIEVLRAACATVARCALTQGLVAMVSDIEIYTTQIPRFSLDDGAGIAQFIMAMRDRQGVNPC